MRIRLLVPILLCLAAGSAGAQGFELGLRRAYTFGSETRAPLFADLNGDGLMDGLVTNLSTDSVTIRFGTGFGNFGPATQMLTGDRPVALALGDLTGDLLPDLVVANETANTVSVFKGVRGGIFFSSARLDFAVGTGPTDVAIGDVTGDGRPDIVAANTGAASVTVLTGAGTGQVVAGSQALTTGTFPSTVEIGDVDGNGMIDIVTANGGASTISVLRGLTTGGFAAKADYATAANPNFMRLGDTDSDGDLDVVTLNTAGKLSLLLNNGSGAYPFHDDLTVEIQATDLELADLTGDGVADVAMSTGFSTNITVLRGSGFSFFAPQPLNMNEGVNLSVIAADVDNDGRRDVVATTQSGRLVAMLAARSPFGAHQDYALGSDPRDFAIADIDGDSLLDIASANYGSADASVLLNAGGGTFPTHTEYPATKSPSLVRLGDIDADGHKELVIATSSAFLADTNRVVVFPNQGNGTFGGRREFDLIAGDGISGLALGETNGDDYLDLVDTHYGGNQLRIWRGDATGGLTPVEPPSSTSAQPAGIGLVDVDADSVLDIVYAASGSSLISSRVNDGAGNFAGPLNFSTGSNGPFEIATGDIDQDGKLDLAVLHVVSHAIVLMKGNGIGGFGLLASLNAQATRGIAIADMNRDGIPDLVYGSGEGMATRYGQGGGVLGGPVASDPIGQTSGLTLGDLDGNGTIDGATGVTPSWVAVLYGKQQTRTVLTVSPNPVVHNSLLTLTATVSPIAPDSSDPSGSVRFFDGEKLLGSAQITNGAATLAMAATLPWYRTYRAEYQGDFRFHGSISRSVTQMTYFPAVAVSETPALTLALAPVRQPSTGGALAMRFTLPGDGAAELAVFDVRGRMIKSLAVGDLGAGTHSSNLGNGLRPGVYLVRLVHGAAAVTTRAVVL